MDFASTHKILYMFWDFWLLIIFLFCINATVYKVGNPWKIILSKIGNVSIARFTEVCYYSLG